jgi:PAS domain S-box-containing protein
MQRDDSPTASPGEPQPPFDNELLHALLAHSGDVVMVIAEDSTLRYVSPSAPRLFGFPLGSHLGSVLLDMVHPDDRDRAIAALAQRVETMGPRGPLELRVAHADGAWRDIEIMSSNRLEDPVVRGVVLNIRDITDRRRAERELFESERWYRQIVETADEGIWTIDADNVTTFVNRRMADMLGVPPNEMIGTNLMDFMDDEGRAAAAANVERRRQGIAEHHDFRFLRADGSELWTILSTATLLEDGVYAGALALVTDVTERRTADAALHAAELDRQRAETESELRRLEVELARAQRLESLGRLAGGVAHDFNNLLGVIVNYAVLVEHRLDPDDPLVDDLRHIQRAAEQASDLTARLLVFARDDPDVEEVTFDLNALTLETVSLVARPFGVAITIVTEFADDVSRVRADRGRLAQVLMNALLNARDALADGGTIRVATSIDGDDVVLDVVDDGVGMAPETARRAFEPFFTTKPLTHGSGLGLSTSYTVVQQAGGRIELNSAPGRGTKLTIRLPKPT